jgi:hypothetical protein
MGRSPHGEQVPPIPHQGVGYRLGITGELVVVFIVG